MPKSTRGYKRKRGGGGGYPNKRRRTGGRYPHTAATKIQNFFRNRRARNAVHKAIVDRAVKISNRSSEEIMYKSYTIVCPDYINLNPSTKYPSSGIACTDAPSAQFVGCYELGMCLKNPASVNGVSAFSQEMLNTLELYRECKIVSGSVSLLKYSAGMGDGQPPGNPSVATPVPPLAYSSIGVTGPKDWVTYIHGVIDRGQFKAVDGLQNLSIPPSTNIASTNADDYFANSNSMFKQISWDTKKSVKQKIIKPLPTDPWSQQYYSLYNNNTPPTAEVQLRCNSPWIRTNVVEAVLKNQYAAGNLNYHSVYALTRLPPWSVYGSAMPIRVYSVGGDSANIEVPLFKVLLSITVAYRVPTSRN